MTVLKISMAISAEEQWKGNEGNTHNYIYTWSFKILFYFERLYLLTFWCVWIKIDRYERFGENLCVSRSHIHQIKITPT